jgi:anti-sigma factor RsiW
MMTCTDAGPRIDGFVDGELPPAVSIDVARHVSQCRRCDATVQNLLAVREALVAETDRALAEVDLSRVWGHVEREMARADAQGAWRERVAVRRSVPRGFVWGTVAAIAAGTALFLRPITGPAVLQVAKTAPTAAMRAAAKRLPNHVYIDRLAGKDIALRRESKSGTTMIWVNHEVDSSGW